MKKRALISVSDKAGVVELAQALVEQGIEIVSTGGTKTMLQQFDVPVIGVEEVTGAKEMLEGRVKTLHPNIHGGLLAKRDRADHMETLKERGISPFDFVIVNLYPFQQTIANPTVTEADAIENIDIGGPTMLRAAAKNFASITVVVDPRDYDKVVEEVKGAVEVSLETRKALAAKVFRHTAAYDAYIANYFTELVGEENPERFTVTYERKQSLRYGENPHQAATFYANPLGSAFSIAHARQHHGKELSFNNIRDADAALQIVKEFEKPAAVAVKHMNPCGVGVGETLVEAYERAYAADPVSIFGGIVALNRIVDKDVAMQLHEIFLEIVIAPAFTDEALEILTQKKNIRLLTIPFEGEKKSEYWLTSVEGGLLVQEQDEKRLDLQNVTVPTKRQPTEEEWNAVELAWNVVKHVKSNAIVLATHEKTVGIGAGQMNRVGAAKIAIEQAGELAEGAAMASDAFFPMNDTVEAAAKAGIKVIIQPGGSIKDQDSIDMADQYGIAMIMTGVRHFKH
ncbi:bifunctional phosphoribosylaminoimidazolecarboxamide formyltransferase/IMP cyclohydrolase [Mangrovibacillus cuniculi]|uniref:Bifunctional purine biosynthesis protein PurH n=1 Tax=Mangrovibacillus cuniculi TaxID=2593652 RepID=A0A7S8C8S2_9BACI|nr:bifunctional phosphoribosylaminoimidazolecarboxamide formyltransferase/IMP cyclohydrolase [Mangrovibacillus cuniculi]QPC45492.1 bifunctional phosphoribosylaminoimidazolecarboxamide formyltransferase/IMP cyclohydrolase [Mangrovibacillus cuniculi]